VPQPAVITEMKPLPGAENAGKPGYYTVRPGDTVLRIALETGQNWRDIARWNNLDNANVIETGQVLRVVPPVATTASADGVVARPVAPASAASAALPPASATAIAPRSPAPTLPPVNTPPVSPGDDEIAWAWPTSGGANVLAGFDEQKNKGIDIAGKPGDHPEAQQHLPHRLRAQPEPAGERRPVGAQGPEDRGDGIHRYRPREAPLRNPPAGQAGGSHAVPSTEVMHETTQRGRPAGACRRRRRSGHACHG